MRVIVILLVGLFSFSCKQTIHIAHITAFNKTIGSEKDSLPVNNDILELIAPYKESMEIEMTRTIGEIGLNMPKKKPESALTNWLGDVLYRQSKAISSMDIDFAMMNWGGIRLPSIQKGLITVGKVYELMPFDNYIVVVEVSGAKVMELFDLIAKSGGGWPLSEHVVLSISDGSVVQSLVNGKEINPKQTYRIATSNFLAEGGDNLTMLLDQPRFEFDEMIRDAIVKDIEQMTKQGVTIFAPESGRVLLK